MLSRVFRIVSSLGFVLAISVIIRVGAAVYLGNTVVTLPGTADQISYHTLANRVLNGHGFSFGEAWWPVTGAEEPTAHWSYLYTIYLVAVYSLFGPNPLAARLIQACLTGLFQPYLAYRLSKSAFDSSHGMTGEAAKRIPVIAAGITAVYFYFIYYAVVLMTEAFFIMAVMVVFLLAFRLSDRIDSPGYWKTALWLGLAIGLAVLFRQLFLLFVPFLLAWVMFVVIRKREGVRGLVSMALTSVVLLGAILPFTYYNYIRYNRFVLLNTNAGYVLFWANHPIHGTNFIPASEMGDTYQQLVPSELRGLDEAALDQALLEKGIRFIIDNPGRYIRLSLSRIEAYFKFWPDTSSGSISNISRVGSFGVFLPFILYGLVRSHFHLRRQNGHRFDGFLASPLALLDGFIIIYSLLHILTWSLVRYRLPVDAVLVLFSARALSILPADASSTVRRFNRGEQKTGFHSNLT